MIDTSENFHIRQHSNGTYTLVDSANDQSMHSRIGPAEESKVVFAIPARIPSHLTSAESSVTLYDVGMGTAANVLAVLNQILCAPPTKGTLSVFSFEEKPEGLSHALKHLDRFPILIPWVEPLKKLLSQADKPGSALDFRVGEVSVHWRLITGDFYAALAGTKKPDFIFYDFYSPKVVPELWSLSQFQELRAHLGDHPATLLTYSAASPVRLHLSAAGFFIGSGASTGVKNETTIAATRMELIERPLSAAWLQKLESSTSISDPEFDAAKAAARDNPQWSLG